MRAIFILMVMFLSITIYAQNTDVPVAATQDFSTRFTKVENVKWIKVADSFHANFMYHEGVTSAVYDATGKWKQTAFLVKHDEIPSTIHDVLIEKYPGCQLASCKFVEEGEEDVFYQIQILHNESSFSIKFTEEGQLIE